MKQIGNIEAEFDKVIRKIGGVPVRELLDSMSPAFENADYLFPDENVIAELKILEKNPAKDDELQRKIQSKFDKWISEGKIHIFGKVQIDSKNLSNEMQWELMRIYSEPVRRVIKKANRQIRKTKEYLKKPAAQGLVIIVNEANYELQPELFKFAADQSLVSDFSSVHGVCLLTVNLGAVKTSLPTTLRLWIDFVRNDFLEIDRAFLQRLQAAWDNHYASLIGKPVPLLEHMNIDLASLRWHENSPNP